MPVPLYKPNYPKESPYRYTQIIGNYMTYYVHRPIPPQQSDRYWILNETRYVNRPDLLSYDLYGTAELFWVVPVRNGLQDPMFDLKIGTPLFLPDRNYVETLL